AEPLQHRIHPLGAEDAHQIVFKRYEEFGGAGIALASRAAAKLIVDAAALMALAADDKATTRHPHDLVRVLDFGADLRRARLAPVEIIVLGEIAFEPHFEIAAQLDVGAAP